MKVLFITDIHWGYSDKGNQRWIKYAKELKAKHPDAIIILGGDNGSNDVRHEIKCLSKMREIFSDNPIYYLMGNHSYWNASGRSEIFVENSKTYTLDGAQKIHQAIYDCAKLLNIKYLPESPIIDHESKFIITGVSGWYESTQFYTNDCNHINNWSESDEWLRKNCYEEFQKTIPLHETYRSKGYKTVLASHFHFHGDIFDWKTSNGGWFGANRSYAQFMTYTDENWFGHTHRSFNKVLDKVHYINTGTDYAKPSHLESFT
jgi:predicted phosphodiesterase